MAVGGWDGQVSKPVKRAAITSYDVISMDCRWGELCSFSLTSKGSVSWANILSHFNRASLTLATPCNHSWQWQMRQCVEERGGGGSEVEEGVVGVPERDGCHFWEKLWLIGLSVLPARLAAPGPGAASVSIHFHTWTNSQTGQEKQPTHPYLSHCPPSTFAPSMNTHHQLPSDLQSFFPPLFFYFYFFSFFATFTFSLLLQLARKAAQTVIPKLSTCSQNMLHYSIDLCIWLLYT